MRTKALLLAAAVTAAGIASIQAQSNVYSVNVVGYVNVTVPANGFGLIANPLNNTNNTIGSVIANPPPGTIFYKYNGGYTVYTFDADDLVWTPNGGATLNPGEGGFVRNPAGTPMTLTFVGEVLQGNLTNSVPNGYSIRSSQVPQTGGITTTLNYQPGPGDIVYKYSNGYTVYTIDADDLVWTPSESTIHVGESFFSLRASGPANWVRNFTVP
jgi:hypothetical protein